MLFTGAPAFAIEVVNAARVEITSAVPDYLQVVEFQAFEAGSGDNIALASAGGVATAFSNGFGGTPGAAIDGVDTPFFFVAPGNHWYASADSGPSEKLSITFGSIATLSGIRIGGRADCCRERDFWNVTIFDASDAVLFSGQLDARTSTTFDAIATFDVPITGGIPEPSTWAMMILGFGAAGAMVRSRRRTARLV